MRIFRIWCAGILAFLCVLRVVHAQEPEESARELVDRDLRVLEDSETAQQDQSASVISFESILNAPDDVNLNLAYAREQIAAGDLREGAATLERILLLRSDLHGVRILYGLVLYRLGLLDRAQFELEQALDDGGDLSPAARAEAQRYLKRIRRALQATRGWLTLTAGVEWDENRNQSPSSGTVLFLDLPIAAAPRNSDFAYIFTAQGHIAHDLGFQAGHTLHGEAIYYRSDKIEIDSLDIDAVSLAIGGTWNSGRLSVTPRFRGSFFWLDGSDYLQVLGGEIDIIMRWRPSFRTYVNFRGEDEDFRVVPNFDAVALRKGRRLSARAGGEWRLSSTQAVRLEGLYMDKNAVVGFESFERYGVFAQHSKLFPRGVFTLIGVWAEKSEYDTNDPFVSVMARSEWLYRGRVSAGAPISFFARGLNLPDAVSSINLIAQYEYENVDSNIANFDYDTHKVSFLVSKRIPF